LRPLRQRLSYRLYPVRKPAALTNSKGKRWVGKFSPLNTSKPRAPARAHCTAVRGVGGWKDFCAVKKIHLQQDCSHGNNHRVRRSRWSPVRERNYRVRAGAVNERAVRVTGPAASCQPRAATTKHGVASAVVRMLCATASRILWRAVQEKAVRHIY
jgi:hypothetical protein